MLRDVGRKAAHIVAGKTVMTHGKAYLWRPQSRPTSLKVQELPFAGSQRQEKIREETYQPRATRSLRRSTAPLALRRCPGQKGPFSDLHESPFSPFTAYCLHFLLNHWHSHWWKVCLGSFSGVPGKGMGDRRKSTCQGDIFISFSLCNGILTTASPMLATWRGVKTNSSK